MQIYTDSEAAKNLAALLEQAESTGKVLIRRKDGQDFCTGSGKDSSFAAGCPVN